MNFYLTTEQELQQGKKIPCNHYHCYRCQYENMWYKETFLNLKFTNSKYKSSHGAFILEVW